MILAGSRQLDQMIRADRVPNLLLLYGEDGLSVTRYQRKLEKLAVSAFPDFNSYRCDGKAPIDLDVLADSALSLPMMAPRRFALVDDLNPELLSAQDLEKLRELAEELGMDALTEAHDERELERALKAGAGIIGVNNRDLRTFQVDMGNSIRLRGLAPEEILFVSESGIRSPEDIRILRENRVDAVLIGETLMRSPHKRAMLEELNGGPL